MAKAVRFHELGGPEVMMLEDVPPPVPGLGEVALAVEAIGLNRGEALFRQGLYLEKPVLPSGIGYEASGIITAVGPDVTSVAVGDAVSVVPRLTMAQYPTYGDHILTRADVLVSRPAEVSATTAAATWMAYLTAYGAIFELGGVQPGDPVLVTAASSSVGLAAIQMLNHVGAIPIATTRSDAKRAALLDAGAAHVIATEEQDLVKEVRALTDDLGVVLAFDAVAGPGAELVAHTVRPDGTLCIYGNLAQAATPVARGLRPLTTRTYTVFEITSHAARLRRAAAFINAGLKAGTLAPVVDRTFDLADVADAHRYLENSTQVGKVVLTVGS